MHQNKNKQHQPVLLQEVLTYLDPQAGEAYLDLTAGYGGHAAEVLNRTQAPPKTTLVDRDAEAIAHLKEVFAGESVELIHQDYQQAAAELASQGRRYDCIMADIGVSSPHLDKASRGFSVQTDEPLDMRMDQRQSLTAEVVLNSYGEEELRRILRTYGEEPKAVRIAREIVAQRPLTTTQQLAKICERAWGGRSKRHPATRTFQAIRIAVNDELGQLEAVLPTLVELLAPGGRMAIISFHSLEDRIVKEFLKAHGGNRYDAQLRLLTKKPVTAAEGELVFNPRARSAKLRAAAKINTKKPEGL